MKSYIVYLLQGLQGIYGSEKKEYLPCGGSGQNGQKKEYSPGSGSGQNSVLCFTYILCLLGHLVGGFSAAVYEQNGNHLGHHLDDHLDDLDLDDHLNDLDLDDHLDDLDLDDQNDRHLGDHQA